MKFKYFILSILFHMLIFVGFLKVPNNKLKRGKTSPNISVNLTMSILGNSNKNNVEMATKKEKKIVDNSKKKTQKKVVKKKEKIIESKPKIVQSKENNPKKAVKKAAPSYTKSNKNIKENPNKTNAIQNNPINNSVLGDQKNDKNLVKIENGQYALKNQKVSGINIVIHKEIPPTYPELALKMGYRKETFVKVKFLVNKNGHVENIQFYTKSKYNFEYEVEKALKQWVFEPVIYKGNSMPIYFYKVFHFVSKN